LNVAAGEMFRVSKFRLGGAICFAAQKIKKAADNRGLFLKSIVEGNGNQRE
jgi:hypothetical protein